jgi:AcrR family transcriptional regulator
MPSTVDPIANSVWARPPRTRAGQPALSRGQILRAALDLLDAEGPDGLSMRRLGTKLGAGATSIYWHVANKDELLDLAIDEVMGEIQLPAAPGADWRAAATALADGLRSMILRHPWITGLFGIRPNIGPNSMRLSDWALAMLTAAGFSGMEAACVSSALTSYAIGSATTEAAWRAAVARSGMTAQDLTKSVETYQLSTGDEYPTLGRWSRENSPLDIEKLQEDSFVYGLGLLLDALVSRLDRARVIPRPG